MLATSYPVFKEPSRIPADSRPGRALHPVRQAPENRSATDFGGTFQHYYNCHQAVNHHLRRPREQRAAAGLGVCGDLPSWCPTWEPGDPGTWGHPPPASGPAFDERRRRNSIICAEGGLVNPAAAGARGPSLGLLRRRRSPARIHVKLPHIRQAKSTRTSVQYTQVSGLLSNPRLSNRDVGLPYARRRRNRSATRTRPEPRRSKLPGSGTGAVSGGGVGV